VEDCSRVHRAVLPRLELAFPGSDLYLEVSSPGINRLIRDGVEFVPFIGKDVACYRLDTSGWSAGVLKSADTEKIILECEGEELVLPYEVIAKARLN
jgi:ribosome maturation factor RimP